MPPTTRGARAEDSSKGGELDPHKLQLAIESALHARGAEVRMGSAVQNLVRRGGPGEPEFVVEAQGLPNLLHEFVHIVLYGALEDDHGIDYQQIPFDPWTEPGRGVLFEELSCALWSCAWMGGTEQMKQAWFEEQISIQPIFYGAEEGAVLDFARTVDGVRRRHRVELEATLDRARRGAIAFVGADVLPAHPQRPPVARRFAGLLASFHHD